MYWLVRPYRIGDDVRTIDTLPFFCQTDGKQYEIPNGALGKILNTDSWSEDWEEYANIVEFEDHEGKEFIVPGTWLILDKYWGGSRNEN